MRKILRSPIILTMLTTGLFTVHMDRAQAMTPAGALRVLAQARAVNGKCHYLSAPVSSELSGYVAKAEVVTASRQGADVASEAIAHGAKAGKASACGADSKDLVMAALTAAREAMRQARKASPAPRRARPARLIRHDRPRHAATARIMPSRHRSHSPTVRIMPSGHKDVSATVRLASTASSAPRTSVRILKATRVAARHTGKLRATSAMSGGRDALKRYESKARAYYVELKCRRLPYRKTLVMWKQVKRMHYALLRARGGEAVGRAKSRAKAQAASASCGPRLAFWK